MTEKCYYETRWFHIEKWILIIALLILVGVRIGNLMLGWTSVWVRILLLLLTETALITGLLYLNVKMKKASSEFQIQAYAVLISFCSLYGLMLLTDTKKSILWLILFLAVLYCLYQWLKIKTTNEIITVATILSMLFSVAILLGHEASHYDTIMLWNTTDFTLDQIALQIFALCGLWPFLAVCINVLLKKIVNLSSHRVLERKLSIREVCSYTTAILLFWMPYYVAFYPGILDKDSISEVSQQLGIETLSNHHPVMHQLVIRLCLKIGQLLDSVTFGVALYSALQMTLMAVIFGCCICYLKKYGTPRWASVTVFLVYACFTVNGFFAITMWKDVLFAGLTLLLVLLLMDFFREKRGAFGWRRILVLVVVAFFFSTMRNNGYYAFILGSVGIAILNKDFRKQMFVLTGVVMLLVTSYHYLLFDVLEVSKSRTAEALSIPIQQIARTVAYTDVDCNNENISILQEVFPDIEELREDYVSVISDGVKHENVFESEVFDENPLRYLKAWARLGLQYPRLYIEAFVLQNYGYWYPDVDYPIVYPRLRENEIGLEANIRFTALRQNLLTLHNILSKQEPIAILYSVGLMVWLMLISVAVLLLKRQKYIFYPALILAALWLTTLASPVYCEYRYIYGFIVCVPLYLTMALILPDNRDKIASDESVIQ